MGQSLQKGMEVTLCLNTKAMERGGGKTATMRKYNEDPLLLTTSETGKGFTWCLKVLKTSCWNQKLPSWGSQLWGPESIITWTVNRNVEKAVLKAISNLQASQMMFWWIIKAKMWWQGEGKQSKYYTRFAKLTLNCVFCWLFFLDFYSCSI